MGDWISVDERLPENGQTVLVDWGNLHCNNSHNYAVAVFQKAAQEGNNKKPYEWDVCDSPLRLFGQEVFFWMPIQKQINEKPENLTK